MARMGAVFDLVRGARTTLGVGRYQGKATGAMALCRQQQSHGQRGAVVLADGYSSSYGTVAGLRGQGRDSVGRQHQRRTTALRCGQR